MKAPLLTFSLLTLLIAVIPEAAQAQALDGPGSGYPYAVGRQKPERKATAIRGSIRELGEDSFDAIGRLRDVVSTRSEATFRERQAEAQRYASKLHHRVSGESERDLDRRIGDYLAAVETCRIEWQTALYTGEFPDCSAVTDARAAAWRLLQLK